MRDEDYLSWNWSQLPRPPLTGAARNCDFLHSSGTGATGPWPETLKSHQLPTMPEGQLSALSGAPRDGSGLARGVGHLLRYTMKART